jgi:hypothetical protein
MAPLPPIIMSLRRKDHKLSLPIGRGICNPHLRLQVTSGPPALEAERTTPTRYESPDQGSRKREKCSMLETWIETTCRCPLSPRFILGRISPSLPNSITAKFQVRRCRLDAVERVMAQIFISYSRKDELFSQRLRGRWGTSGNATVRAKRSVPRIDD